MTSADELMPEFSKKLKGFDIVVGQPVYYNTKSFDCIEYPLTVGYRGAKLTKRIPNDGGGCRELVYKGPIPRPEGNFLRCVSKLTFLPRELVASFSKGVWKYEGNYEHIKFP